MALTNAEKQAAFRDRMRAEGYVRREVWVKGDVLKRDLKTVVSYLSDIANHKLDAKAPYAAITRIQDIFEN